MAAGGKRMSIVITPELEAALQSAKRELFYDRTRSEMIRELVAAGLRAARERENGKSDGNS